MSQYLLSFISIIFLSGCTSKLTEPNINFMPPKYVEEIPSKIDTNLRNYKGSIFGQGDNPLFSDHKAMHENDIITVIITEKTNSTNTAKKSLSENDKLGLNGGTFVGNNSNSTVSSMVNKLNGLSNIGFSAGSDSSYSGSGSSSKNALFTTTISARIIKVMNNGNYFIEGKREILVDNQKQMIQISGVIRPYDIGSNNQIDSSKIADAKILYKNEGDIENSTNQGWGSKLVQYVWPF